MIYEDAVENLEKLENDVRHSEVLIEKCEQEIQIPIRQLNTIEECIQIAVETSEKIRQDLNGLVSSLATRCMRAILDEPYELKIVMEKKRNKTESRLVFSRDGMELDPMTSSGGGVLDIASFALRLSVICLTRPKKSKVVILDEPFRFVSEKYRSKVRELMEQLSEEMGFQFVMVTHIDELKCGRIVEL